MPCLEVCHEDKDLRACLSLRRDSQVCLVSYLIDRRKEGRPEHIFKLQHHVRWIVVRDGGGDGSTDLETFCNLEDIVCGLRKI